MASSCKEGYYFCNSSQKCKRIPKGYKVQSDGYLVREYVSDWRSDIQEVAPSSQNLSTLKDRKAVQRQVANLPTFIPKTTTTTNNGNTSTSVSMVNRREATANAINRMPKIGGVKVQMDADGNVPNAGDFAAKASTKELNKPFVSKVGNTVLGKNNFNQVKKYASGGELERDVNSSVPGSQQFRLNIAGDEVNQSTQKYKKPNRRINNVVTNNEELQGGVSVEPYTKDTKFLEVETVDIIKAEPLDASNWRSELGENLGIKMPTVRPGQFTSTGGSGKAVPLPKIEDEKLKSTDGKGKVVPLPKVKPGQFKEEIVDEGNRTKGYTGSFEADLENMIIEILEENINVLHNDGFSYEEIAEFYDVKEELLNEGLIDGAISGARIIGKYAPKVFNFAKNRGIKDRKILTQFVTNPKNLKRANTDIQKIIDAPKNTYNLGKSFRQFADKGYKALKGGAQKLIEPIKKKGQVDRAKYKKYQDLVNRANRLAKSKAERAGQIVDVAPKTTNLPQSKKSLPLTKNVTKDMSPKEIRSKGMNLLAKLQGKTPKQQKAKELTDRMSKAVDTSKKPTTYSGKVDAAKNIPDPGAIVKSSSSAVTAVKPSLDTTKGINMSLSSMASKVKNLLTGKKPSKQITGTKTPQKLSGTNVKGSLPSGSSNTTSSKKKLNNVFFNRYNERMSRKGSEFTQKKFKMAREWDALNNAAAATMKSDKMAKNAAITGAAAGLLGVVAGSQSTKNSKKIIANPTESPKALPSKENKTIKNTEKKIVDPKKNDVISTSKKNTTSKNVNQWGRSKQYTADDGKTTVDRSDVFTKAAFDFGPNIKKGQAIGVVTRNQRKKYDLEATRRKSVKEGVAAIPSAIPLVKGAIKVGGAVLAAKGGEEGIKKVIDTFRKRRDAQKEYKDSINKGIQNTRDSEADKRVADAARDPDLEKIGRMENPNVVDFKKPNKPKK